MSQPLVLLVEDDPNQAKLYSDELTDEGYQIEVVPGGEEAIEFVKQRRPDVVVLDIHMPKMDGIEVLQRLLDICRQLPIILHTAYSNYQDDLRTWSAVGYVIKEMGMEELKQAIHRSLQERR